MWISLSVKMINKSSRTKLLNRIGLTFNAPNVAKKKKCFENFDNDYVIYDEIMNI